MEYRNLQLESVEGVIQICLNRPQALNALNEELVAELIDCLEGIAEDSSVKVVILTGAGEKAFVAGADIAAMKDLDAMGARSFALQGQRMMNLIETLPQPVIAAVNGFALGGGCELAMACDLRLASENARFGQPEVNLGVIPGFAGTQRLPRLVGKGRAMELLLTGEMIDAAEALRIGLVNRLVPRDELLGEARGMAKKIAAKGQSAIRLCKEAVHHGLQMDAERAYRFEADLFSLCFATEDQKEGMAAFVEKRPARFSG